MPIVDGPQSSVFRRRRTVGESTKPTLASNGFERWRVDKVMTVREVAQFLRPGRVQALGRASTVYVSRLS
jgi:hypothetical protein